MRVLAAISALLLALLMPTAAFAYVGPGAGLSLLGALWALIVALGIALMFIVAWPVRALLRKRRRTAQRGEEGPPSADLASVHGQPPQQAAQ